MTQYVCAIAQPPGTWLAATLSAARQHRPLAALGWRNCSHHMYLSGEEARSRVHFPLSHFLPQASGLVFLLLARSHHRYCCCPLAIHDRASASSPTRVVCAFGLPSSSFTELLARRPIKMLAGQTSAVASSPCALLRMPAVGRRSWQCYLCFCRAPFWLL